MSQRVRIYRDDEFVGWFTLPPFGSGSHIANRWDRRDLAQTNLYRLSDGRFILHSWDHDDASVGRIAQILTAEEAARWLEKNNLPIPEDMEHLLGGEDLDNPTPEADGPVPLIIGGFRGDQGRQQAEVLRQVLQARFGFAGPAANIPFLKKLRCLHQKVERTAGFFREHLPRGYSEGFPFVRQSQVGTVAAMGILTGEITALEDLLRELFGLGGDQTITLPTCTANASVSILRTFDLARDFRTWLHEHPHEIVVPAELAQRFDATLSLLQRAIASEEAASAEPHTPSNSEGQPRSRPTGKPAALANGRRVVLRGPGECPSVCGEDKDPLTLPQYDVVKALLEAGERGLSKDELDRKSKHGDSRKILKRLAESDPDWKAAISFPGKPGGGYRIR